MSFDRWMDELDSVCQTAFGLSINDLPDMCFRDAFDCGMAPSDFMAENLPDVSSLRELILS